MKEPRWPRFVASVLGFAWFLQTGGGPTLNPLNTAWISVGDWQQHWLGFLFFQRDRWHFPLGTLTTLLYPVGTNIGFTDSNPFLAILVKPFAGFLPPEFQLIGPWLAACFILQGYFGAALASAVTKDAGQQLLGGYLIVLSPVLVARLGHDTLCAHWVVLALLYLGLREYHEARVAERSGWLSAAAVAFAASVHPYLAAMSWALALAVMIRLWRTGFVPLARAAVLVAATTAGLFGVWYVIGYLAHTPDGGGGFGTLASHLATFIDPRETTSRLLPGWPSDPGTWEGYGFLGLGGIVAGVGAIGVLFVRRPTWRAGVFAPILVCLMLAVFATLNYLFDLAAPLTSTFRASGRFIWPLHYLTLAFGIWGTAKIVGRSKQPLGMPILALVVALQAADLNTAGMWAARSDVPQIALEPYTLAAGRYQHLALAPMQVLGGCGSDPYPETYTYRFMLLAHRLHMTFNSGIFARLDLQGVHAACDAQTHAVDTGSLDPKTIYIVLPGELPRFKRADAACGRWDGHWICVSRGSDPRFARWIETGKDIGAGSQ